MQHINSSRLSFLFVSTQTTKNQEKSLETGNSQTLSNHTNDYDLQTT